jgi:hypothetical protein
MSTQVTTRLNASALGSSEVAFNDTNIQTGTRITTLVTDVQADFANRHWIVRIPNDATDSSAITGYITNDNYREMIDRFKALGDAGSDVISILTSGLTRYDAGSFSDNMMIHEAISTVSFSEGSAPFLLSRSTYSTLVRAINSVVSGYAIDEIKDSIVDSELAVVDVEDVQAYPTPDQMTNVVANLEVLAPDVVALIDEGRGDMNLMGTMSVANKDDEYAASAAETVSVSNVGTVPDEMETVAGDLTDFGGLLTNAIPVKDLVNIVNVVPCVYVGDLAGKPESYGLADPDYRPIIYQSVWERDAVTGNVKPDEINDLDVDLPLMQQEFDFNLALTSVMTASVAAKGKSVAHDTKMSTIARYRNIIALLDVKEPEMAKSPEDANHIAAYAVIGGDGNMKLSVHRGIPVSELVSHDIFVADDGTIVHSYLPIMCAQTLGWYQELDSLVGISLFRFYGTKRGRCVNLRAVGSILGNIGKLFNGIANNVMKNPGLIASLGSVASGVINTIAPGSTLGNIASTASGLLSSFLSGGNGAGTRMYDIIADRIQEGRATDADKHSFVCSVLPNAVRSGAAVLSSSLIAMPNVKKSVGDAQRMHTRKVASATVRRTFVPPRSRIPVRARRNWKVLSR